MNRSSPTGSAPLNQPPILVRQSSFSGRAMRVKAEHRRKQSEMSISRYNAKYNSSSTNTNTKSSSTVSKPQEQQQEDEQQQQQQQLQAKTTSASNSYLKSRRAQARAEKREAIFNMVDKNLNDSTNTVDTANTASSTPPTSPFKQKSTLSNKTKTTSSLPISPNPGSKSRKTIETSSSSISPKEMKKKVEETSALHKGMRLVNIFRRNKKSGTSNNPTTDESTIGSSTAGGVLSSSNNKQVQGRRSRRISQRRQEQQTALRQLSEREKMESVVEQVLQKYPKACCNTFADHQQYATAELTTHSRDFYMTPTKFAQLKSILEEKLQEKLLLEDEDTVDDSAKVMMTGDGDDNHNSKESYWPGKMKRKPKTPCLKESRPKPHSTNNKCTENQREDDDSSINSDVMVAPPPPDSMWNISQSTKSLEAPSQLPESFRSTDINTQQQEEQNQLMAHSDSQEVEEDSSIDDDDDYDKHVKQVDNMWFVDPKGQGGLYSGTVSCADGKPHGHGTLEYSESYKAYYEGQWNHGKWNGMGTYVKANGDTYQGHFVDHVKHGMGCYTYKGGKRQFEGRYVMGQRVDGIMKYDDGSWYKGQWYRAKRHGRGQYKFVDGTVYRGEFNRDKIHGVGELTWPDGSRYVGEWSQGDRHGVGKEYYADGKLRYDGLWKHNRPVHKKKKSQQ